MVAANSTSEPTPTIRSGAPGDRYAFRPMPNGRGRADSPRHGARCILSACAMIAASTDKRL